MIFLASPYSHETRTIRLHRVDQVRDYLAVRIGKHREHIFSPIIYAHELSVIYGLNTSATFWHSFNTEMMLACSSMRVLMLEGWQESVGVTEEIRQAQAFALPIEFVEWP